MSARTLTEPTLRALLAQLAARGDRRGRAVAVASEPRWSGDEVLSTELGPARIVPCQSPLAVRAALVDHQDRDGELLVILTDLDERVLGEEVLGRLVSQRVLTPTSYLALQQLAKVDQLDPRLANQRWLVELLVRVAPTRGFPPPKGGMLTVDAAWRYVYRYALALPADQPQLTDLLTWAVTGDAHHAVAQLSADDRAAIADHLAEVVSPAAVALLHLVADGRGSEAVPFGLVADVVWRDETDPQLAYTRANMENTIGAGKLDAVAARAWGQAAAMATRTAMDNDDRAGAQDWIARAQQLLDQHEAGAVAGNSVVLPRGFDQRLEQAGYALEAVVADPNRSLLDPLEQLLTSVTEHLSARQRPDRVEALRAAVRLARRLVAGAPGGGSDLAGLARRYERDGSWVDAARDAMQGETVPALADAYQALLAAIDADRQARDAGFGRALASWTQVPVSPDDDSTLLPIERVIERVVAPLAARTPVLVLVIDGLAHATAHPLLADLASQGWRRMAPVEDEKPSVVAALPTVTVVSRTSLLTGSLQVGDQRIERDGFEAHPALRPAGRARPPRLFHRSDLGEVEGRVAPEVQTALRDEDQQVVGIVVNAADDHLAKGSQLRLVDGVAGIRPLGPILTAASEAGRAIVLTSDHGHIVEHGTTYRQAPGDSGERWRAVGSTPPADDEVELAGERVLYGDGRIIAPTTDTVRYITADKRGYHGGATPAEVLCPLAILLPSGVEVDGLAAEVPEQPLWWSPLPAGDDQPAPADTATPPARGSGRAPASTAGAAPTLFDDEPADQPDTAQASDAPADAPRWVADLLASPTLAQQRAMSGRATLNDDEVAAFVQLLIAAGGTLPMTAIAERLSVAPLRIRGKLDALRRLLNVDGYEVLDVDADGMVTLNRQLLATQFGLVLP